MSDEKFENVYKLINVQTERIEELEQKIEIIERFKDTLIDDTVNAVDKVENGLSGLRTKVNGMSNGCSLAQQNLGELTELKDKRVQDKSSIDGLLKIYEYNKIRSYENRGVLRDFFKKLPSYSLSDIHVADIDNWLDKLSGEKVVDQEILNGELTPNPLGVSKGSIERTDSRPEIPIPKDLVERIRSKKIYPMKEPAHTENKECPLCHTYVSWKPYPEPTVVAVEKEDLQELKYNREKPLHILIDKIDKFLKKYLSDSVQKEEEHDG